VINTLFGDRTPRENRRLIEMAVQIFGVSMLVIFFVFYVYAWYKAKYMGTGADLRPIPQYDALREGVGRATEMGEPVFYSAGVASARDPSIMAGITLSSHISELCARSQTQLIIGCFKADQVPLIEDVVHLATIRAGHPEAKDLQEIHYFSETKFPGVAKWQGMMERQGVATCFLLGAFGAEDLQLIMAARKYGAMVIGGVTSTSHMPFFAGACDYTIQGDELFAASAYITQEPVQTNIIMMADIIRLILVVIIVIGAIATIAGSPISGLLSTVVG